IDRTARNYGVEITTSKSDGQFHLRACHRHDSARVFGLADSAVRIASTIHAEILDSSLQYRASAHGAGSRRPRYPVHRSRLPASNFAPSPRRIVRRPCQVDPWRTASPIFPRTCLCVTRFLRTTTMSSTTNREIRRKNSVDDLFLDRENAHDFCRNSRYFSVNKKLSKIGKL